MPEIVLGVLQVGALAVFLGGLLGFLLAHFTGVKGAFARRLVEYFGNVETRKRDQESPASKAVV